jgi:uncharacterized protein (UPF0212 family)
MAPDSAALLTAWERGLRLPVPHRLLLLLAAVFPERSEEEIAALSLGARDTLLLDLREHLFGSVLATVSACPKCNERLEATLQVADIRVSSKAASDEHKIIAHGHHIRFRLPATADVLAIPAGTNSEVARSLLIGRCVIEARDALDNPVAPQALPPEVIPDICAQMADADPQASVDLSLNCPACGHSFDAAFDIASFLLAELHGWAQRMIADVGSLARVFGWREADVLALSPIRRQLYLELAAR